MKIVDPWGILLELTGRLNLLRERELNDGDGAREAWSVAELRVKAAAVERALRDAGASETGVRDFWAWQKAAGRVK